MLRPSATLPRKSTTTRVDSAPRLCNNRFASRCRSIRAASQRLQRAARAPVASPGREIKASAVVHAGGVAALAAIPGCWPRSSSRSPPTMRSSSARASRRGAACSGRTWCGCRRRRCAAARSRSPSTTVPTRTSRRACWICSTARAPRRPSSASATVRARFRGSCARSSRRGHAVENHSDGHSTAFGWYGPGRLRARDRRGAGTLAALAGRTPAFFRAPVRRAEPVRRPGAGAARARLRVVDAPRLRHGGPRSRPRAARGSPAGSTPATCCAPRRRRGRAGARRDRGARGAAAPARARRGRGLNRSRSLPPAVTDPSAERLFDAAARRYAPAGRFARHFARRQAPWRPGVRRDLAARADCPTARASSTSAAGRHCLLGAARRRAR